MIGTVRARLGKPGRNGEANGHLVWLAGRCVRSAPMLLFGGWLVSVLANRVGALQVSELAEMSLDTPLVNLLLGVCATAVSFIAVSRYDVHANRALGFSGSLSREMKSGFAATSLAQFVGLGLISGALVRWRVLGARNVTLFNAAALTFVVTAGFLASAAVGAAATWLLWGRVDTLQALFCSLVLIAALGFVAASLFQPRCRVLGRKISMPKVKTTIGFLGLTLIDLGFAGLAFFLMLPQGAGIEFTTLIPVFILATGAGILSGVPGGVGAFELVLLASFPQTGPQVMLSAILAFRLVYYVAPALVGFLVFLRAEMEDSGSDKPGASQVPVSRAAISGALRNKISNAARAEARLGETGEFSTLSAASCSGFLLTSESGNSLVAISDPVAPIAEWQTLFAAQMDVAQARNLHPVLYKCGARMALRASKLGYKAYQIGQEAVIDPRKFTQHGPQMRGLRRKLRQAEAAKVLIRKPGPLELPLPDMQQVSDQWIRRQGRERGFSMGKFNPAVTDSHEFYLAYQDNMLVGFIGLWKTRNETALDLLRSSDDAPNGTMHALVFHAVQSAAKSGTNRFSLSGVPFSGLEGRGNLVERVCNWIFHNRPDWHHAQGLRQFKNSFRPEWEPRYLVAKNPLAAAIAGWDICRLIQRPKTRQTPV